MGSHSVTAAGTYALPPDLLATVARCGSHSAAPAVIRVRGEEGKGREGKDVKG